MGHADYYIPGVLSPYKRKFNPEKQSPVVRVFLKRTKKQWDYLRRLARMNANKPVENSRYQRYE